MLELLVLIVLTDIALNDPDPLDILFHRIVQRIKFRKADPEILHCLLRNDIQSNTENRNNHQERQSDFSTHVIRHCK